MRRVELEAVIPDTDAGTVFDNVVRFDRYPELAPHVESATVHATWPEKTGSSSWELHFRSGLLRWQEDDTFLREELRIEFEQSDGDFDSFSGAWELTQDGADCRLRFHADFDFGIVSLEGILDPIAERVIKETVAWAVSGMFTGVSFTGDLALAPAPQGAAAVD